MLTLCHMPTNRRIINGRQAKPIQNHVSAGRELIVETGKTSELANGSAGKVRYGENRCYGQR